MSGTNAYRVLGTAWMLWSVSLSVWAGDPIPAPCYEEEVLLHVRGQFATYGPRSSQFEYFGFIYRKDGQVESAVTHDFACRGQMECVVNTAFALKRIPKRAKVLGEWHTHPHFHEADELSMEDVRGAQANRHIRCYTAFYSSHDGDIYRWNLDAPTVAAAMASRTRVGNYRVSDAHSDSKLADNSGISVAYGDLDLDKPADARILFSRLEEAAKRACGPKPFMQSQYDVIPEGLKQAYKECRANALGDAVARLNAPLVSRIYAESHHTKPNDVAKR